MASIVNRPPRPALPVTVDFYFEQAGPPGSATYDGDTYPYPPLPSDDGSDYRYAWGTTPVFLAVEFFATREKEEKEEETAREKWVKEEEEAKITKKEREEKIANQTKERRIAERIKGHVTPPPGVTILEYLWDFGDGFVGHGPTVTHTYEVADPDTEISLTILDSLGREWSTSKALSLVFVDFGYTYPRIRGVNTETPPKRKTAEGEGEKALTIEGTPTRIWIARAGQPVREETEQALAHDRARVTTHFLRSTADVSLSNDAVTRTRNMVRHGGKPPHEDIALTADTPTRSVNQLASAEDESLTEENAPTGKVFHAFEAALSFVASLAPKLIP